MKYRLEGLTIEAIDTYVRLTLGSGKVVVTKKECPDSVDVANLLSETQGYRPNKAQLQACARAAQDARDNVIELAL
jgi:hypothetical protein